MPSIDLNGTTLHYEDTGGDFPPVLFSHGLLFSAEMFSAQVRALAGRYRCIAWDHRGQGRSADPGGRIHTIEQTTDDALALIRALGIGPAHFVGLSMGGFVGLRIAMRHPELLRSLVLLETSADPEPAENVPRYSLLAAIASWFGVGIVVGRVMPIMFSKSWLNDPSRAAERAEWRRRLGRNGRGIVRAVRGVIEREGVAHELGRIRTPTLVIVGEEDVATTPEKAERLVAGIPGATLERVPAAGHSSSIEQPERITALLRAFFAAHPG
jgi:3-oxoadipate enol-lactonase